MKLLHQLPYESAEADPERVALHKGELRTGYGEFVAMLRSAASGLVQIGVGRRDRVAIYLPKQVETVVAMFGTSAAGAVFVPVNPVLKPPQVGHILRDSGARVLVTSAARAAALEAELASCPELRRIVIVDESAAADVGSVPTMSWSTLLEAGRGKPGHRAIDTDPVAILYTSGSTGKPKGVVLSHRNMVAGAASVSEYLENRETDRLLAALPFSFDYGFSQLSTAFLTGASVVLMDYLMPRDIVRAIERHAVTGLAAVPPLWIQLAELEWPEAAVASVRYITNSGGAMPQSVLAKLRGRLPRTSVYLMYGLTEAFRSTYLPPSETDKRPTSMGKAIPNAEVLVVRPDGTECAPGEPGELVHRGALVSLGYWNDPARTAERFRPLAHGQSGLPLPEMAVWSGDTVVRDEEGYLYFVGRRDEMIKTSGYRVSPTEIEEAIYGTGLVAEAIAVGVPHHSLGQAIVVVAVPLEAGTEPTAKLVEACREALPAYMLPSHVEWRDVLPRNANGKIDRPALAAACAERFGEPGGD
jgi:acyl-CoA ligase (AMP-forming) (exosortase A-associated)